MSEATTMIEKDVLIEELKQVGKKISAESSDGCELATEIIKWYSMWHKCPGDNMAYVMCEEAYKKWKSK